MYRLLRILILPHHVFKEIREPTPYQLPLWLILLLGFACFTVVQVDPSSPYWFIQALVAPFVSLWYAVCTLGIMLVWACYFWVAGTLLNVDIGWRNWFGFTCWIALPSAIGSVAGVLILKLSPAVDVDANPLIGWFGMTFLSVFWVPIPLVWSLYIAVNGFLSWTDKSLTTSMLVVLAPPVVLTMLQVFTSVPFIADFVRLTSF